MREIRTLRATWRGLETWCGSGPPGHTGAPALDPTDERGWETGRWPQAPSYRAHPRLYHLGFRSVSTRARTPGITAPTASHNGRNVALAVQTRLFLSPSPPRLERISIHDAAMRTQRALVLQGGPFRRVEQALGTELSFQRKLRRMLVAATIIGPVALAPEMSSAEGLLDFFFGGSQKQQHETSFFANIFNNNLQPPPPRPVVASSGPGFCVRSCDGKYFPLMRGAASPTQMCQAFCPASPTEVFFGSSIDSAYAASGERYADSENAFAYRKALRADCTCNGHNPAGLAPVDLALDGSLRPGDVLATHDGLVAYSGIRAGNDQTPGFTPVASFPGLTPQVRARLNDMKVAPARADMAANNAATSEVTRTPLPAATIAPKPVPARDKRVDAD